jgi:hypothetical protein
MSRRIGSVKCWYRAAIAVHDQPTTPIAARSGTPTQAASSLPRAAPRAGGIPRVDALLNTFRPVHSWRRRGPHGRDTDARVIGRGRRLPLDWPLPDVDLWIKGTPRALRADVTISDTYDNSVRVS